MPRTDQNEHFFQMRCCGGMLAGHVGGAGSIPAIWSPILFLNCPRAEAFPDNASY